jgi:hypothetical protein
MPDSFLHERTDFNPLVESEKINDPALVEKDYWIMHAVFGLKQLGLTFELKGGTSLVKGFGVIHRFSEDIGAHSHRALRRIAGRHKSKSRKASARRVPTTIL